MDSKQGKRETNRRGEIMLKAVFSRFGEEIELTDELWQYDFGQKIQVTGIELPDVCEVHFQYDNLTETKTVTGYKQENALIIDIPNEALTSRGIIKLYIYLVSSEEGRTVNVAIMHVNRRMKPEGFEVPEDIDLFHHTLLAANEYMQQTKSAKKSAETAANQAEDAKNAAEAAAGSAQASADKAKTAKENAETAAKVAEAFKTEAETARSEAVRAATGSTDAKDSAEKSRAAAEKAKQDAEEAKAAADADKEAAEAAQAKAEAAQKAAENAETEAKKAQTATEAAKRETETAKNDAVQAKEAAEKAKSGTAADREVTEAASKAAQVSAISAEKSAERAETAKEEIQESADQIQKNAIEIDSLKENKIEKPAETPTIGKILRVKSVNEDGTFICEWADSGGSNLDVRINGESIVQNGTAEIPLCTKTKEAGLISIDTYTSNGGLHRANNETGLIRIASATNNQIDERRNKFCPIVPETIDYAVKAAMCDGKGAMWTADEQTAARERMGAWTGDWQIIMDETLAELTQEVSFEVPDDTKEMICYFKSGAAPKDAQVYLRTSNNGSSIAESFASFGGSLSNNTISIGCQKIQFLNSQYGLIEYSYLSHSTPSSADYAQRAGKPSLLRIDSKRFAFHSVDINGGYPVETRLLVLVRR
jgi:hypothetical protein